MGTYEPIVMPKFKYSKCLPFPSSDEYISIRNKLGIDNIRDKYLVKAKSGELFCISCKKREEERILDELSIELDNLIFSSNKRLYTKLIKLSI